MTESHDSPFSDQFCPCILHGCALWSKVARGSRHWSFLSVHSFGGTLWFSCLVQVVLIFILLVLCGSESLLWSVLSLQSFGFACFVSKSPEAPFSGRFCPCSRLGLRALSQSRPRLPSLVGFVLAVVWVCVLCLKVARGSLLWSVLSLQSFGFACFVSKSPEAPFCGRFAFFLMVRCACGSKSHERVLVRDTWHEAALLFCFFVTDMPGISMYIALFFVCCKGSCVFGPFSFSLCDALSLSVCLSVFSNTNLS